MLDKDDHRFIRIGKSLIVNRDYIAFINQVRQKLILSDCRSFRYEVSASKEALKALWGTDRKGGSHYDTLYRMTWMMIKSALSQHTNLKNQKRNKRFLRVYLPLAAAILVLTALVVYFILPEDEEYEGESKITVSEVVQTQTPVEQEEIAPVLKKLCRGGRYCGQ